MTSDLRTLTARCLRLDREAVLVGQQLTALGIEYLVLKGPALQRWLYGGDLRPYGDIDLMVAPENQHQVISVLEERGYAKVVSVGHEVATHATNFATADGLVVDLHHRLSGVLTTHEAVWAELSRESREIALGSGCLSVCSPSAQALVVVLHAAQHGVEETKPLDDLARLAATASQADLLEAAKMAGRLGATQSFAAGLRLCPALAHRLPDAAEEQAGLLVKARAASVHDTSGVLLLATLGSRSVPRRERLRMLARAAWPTSGAFDADRVTPVMRLRRWRGQVRQLPQAIRELRRLS